MLQVMHSSVGNQKFAIKKSLLHLTNGAPKVTSSSLKEGVFLAYFDDVAQRSAPSTKIRKIQHSQNVKTQNQWINTKLSKY